MKVSLNWLKEYIEINLTSEEISHHLTMLGLEIEHLEKTKDDTIFEISVTTNRGDCLSIIGLAGEISLINNKDIHHPPLFNQEPSLDVQRLLAVFIKEKELCPRYSGRVIKNIKITPSPSWIQERLISCGIKPVNNIVDITNFVLMEYGQPMHAFDYDLISERRIIVRRAEKGERIKTLDNQEISLDSEILVIADQNKPIAIAGIIGGSETAINNNTTNILLESAYFKPVTIRKNSQKLNITTESSYRFERDMDLLKTTIALERATELILKDNPSSLVSTIYDLQELPYQKTIVALNIDKVNSILGTFFPLEEIINILKKLKLEIITFKDKDLTLEVPSFRKDISREIDVIEEIARVYGYNKIPTSLYNLRIDDFLKEETFDDLFYKFTNQIKNILNSLGLYETINYPFLRKKWLKYVPFSSDHPVTIQNPLNEEENIMAPTLLFSFLNCISSNIKKGNNDLKIYEIGKTYHQLISQPLPNEITNLAGALTGKKTKIFWGKETLEVDIFDLTGILEKLCLELGIEKLSYQPFYFLGFLPSLSYQIIHRHEYLGIIGEISPELLDEFKISQKILYFELNLDYLIKIINLKKEFKPLPKYPPNFRDVSLVTKEKVSYELILNLIQEINHPYIKEVNLFDVYRGPQIPQDCKSLAFRITYQSLEETLSDEKVDKLHQLVINNLTHKLNAQLR
ncbi:phenylalanine--tRNA ligase subunit beta [bacterium]|nr:phenylalanine--tRNA ligase subunit beta [bacterium]